MDNFRPQQLEVLYDFFTTKTEYWKMSPHLELVARTTFCWRRPAENMSRTSRAEERIM